jgi:hypothetical protein
MSVWNEPISLIRARLRDLTVFNGTGWNVQNYDLDLLNRAQMWLSTYKDWTLLTKRSVLTIGTDRSASLPSDLNSVIAVYADLDGSGIPAVFYTLDDIDVGKRYLFENDYTVAGGHVWKIRFPANAILSGTIYIHYSFRLADYTGSETPEYSFFPPNLLLRCAQKIHIEDKGMTGDSAQFAINAFNEELRKFETNSQLNNVVYDTVPHNAYGQPIKINGYQLGRGALPNYQTPYLPSTFRTN